MDRFRDKGIVVDNVKFVVVQRLLMGNRTPALYVHSSHQLYHADYHLIFSRSLSEGGCFRICLQAGDGKSTLLKGVTNADYTRSLFVKVELQLHFSKCFDLMIEDSSERVDRRCADAYRVYFSYIRPPRLQDPGCITEEMRKIKTEGLRPVVDFKSIQELSPYTFDYEIQNNVVIADKDYYGKAKFENGNDDYKFPAPTGDHAADELAQQKWQFLMKYMYRPQLGVHHETTNPGDDIFSIEGIKFHPTHASIQGRVFKVNVHYPNIQPAVFYYLLAKVNTTVDPTIPRTSPTEHALMNPVPLKSYSETNVFVPWITVPRSHIPSVPCDCLGIYHHYLVDSKETISKLFEYTQYVPVAKRGSQIAQNYVVNKGLLDNSTYRAVRTRTLQKLKHKVPRLRSKTRRAHKAF